MKAQKKPVVIEFCPIKDLITIHECNNCIVLPEWVNRAISEKKINFVPLGIEIWTLEGIHLGKIKDILIQGVQGEIYPCKPDIFAETYEVIDE